MDRFAVKGHICTSTDADHIIVHENSYLVCCNGVCEGVYQELPESARELPITDFGDRILIPGMSDLHIHAPQFAYRGLGMDMELLDWLNSHAFPEESKYANLTYADRAYDQFVSHLRRSETTRASIFATVHVEATMMLMEKMEASGLVSYIGKVNMNRNCPEFLCEKDSAGETRRWLELTRDRWRNTGPIITPRFIPSCTDDLLKELGALSMEFGVPVQSHLSENLGEIQWVGELVPSSRYYGDAYDQFGLFGGKQKCIMAHCVYSGEEELAKMKEHGVMIAHCPESNMNVSSGVAPVNRYLDAGLMVGLATDVAGGSHESMFRAMTHAIQASKLRWRLLDQSVPPLTFDRAFYMATKGGGAFFGKVGSLEKGYELDLVVLDDQNLDHPQNLTVRERLERVAYLGDERNIHAKYVAGKRLF